MVRHKRPTHARSTCGPCPPPLGRDLSRFWWRPVPEVSDVLIASLHLSPGSGPSHPSVVDLSRPHVLGVSVVTETDP